MSNLSVKIKKKRSIKVWENDCYFSLFNYCIEIYELKPASLCVHSKHQKKLIKSCQYS